LNNLEIKNMIAFIKMNWFKLSLSLSLFLFSIGFLISSVSPAYSNLAEPSNKHYENTVQNGGYLENGNVYFVDKGSVYYCQAGWLDFKSSWKKLCTLPD
jgi:hypothetical protein